MWITRVSVRQPVFATMVMLALVVLGLYSYRLMPVDEMPEVAMPEANVQVIYPGASPEALETDVIKPLEEVINGIDGVRNIYATASEGMASMSIEFRMDVDVVTATQEIRDRVAQVRSRLPRDIDEPTITRARNDSSQNPAVTLGVFSDTRDLREVSTLVDQQIAKRLQNAYGVGSVMVRGAVQRQVQIYLQPEQLRSFGVSVDQVIQAIRAANQDLPAGRLAYGAQEQLVRVEGRMRQPADFERIIVANQGGAPVYLRQVAQVMDGEAEETSISRFDGRRSVTVDIFKVQQANLVEVGKDVDRAIAELQASLPADVQVRTLWSNAQFIEGSLDRVKATIMEGAALTILIVFLFLHSWRSTVITGLTLPIAVIATFTVLHALGFTLNFMTLMGLSLCIGLLIDDAIVVRENIVRHLGMGKDHYRAALEGTQEIGLAVLATTFAILAVFVPIAFMGGVIGKFFLPFGITVAVAVLVSLFVSFTLDPMLSSVWPDPSEGRFRRFPWLQKVVDGMERGIDALHRVYDRLLRWALQRHRYGIPGLARIARRRGAQTLPRWAGVSPRALVLLVAVGTFFGSFLLLPMVGTEFLPRQDLGISFIRVNTPIGSSLEYTDAKVRDVEAALREVPGVTSLVTTVGTQDGRNYARLLALLDDRSKRPSLEDVETAIRERVGRIAGIELTVDGNNGKPVVISILGPEAGRLTELSEELMRRLSQVRGIADLESSERGANPTLAVRINNELASELGVTTAAIGQALRPLLAGDEIGTWVGPDGQDYDVIVQLPRDRRGVAQDLADLTIASTRMDANGRPLLVPLRQVAQFVETGSPQQIKRLNLQRRITLYANAQGRPAGDVGSEAQRIAQAMEMPPGYRIDIGGGQQEMNQTFSAALAALALAVVFIYLVLASQFGSFLQPVAIMMSLPLSLIGVLLALAMTGTTLNIFSLIGFIMLMGLVTKNAILLVDFTNQALRAGRPVREAILEAGQVRLRPILMTTLAMVFGMLPMSIGVGAGGELLAPMGRAVIGGVLTSALLTLVVVPVLFTYIHAMAKRAKAYWRRSSPTAVGTVPRDVPGAAPETL